MRRRLFVLLGMLVLMAAASTTANARRGSTVYDGLMFRLRSVPTITKTVGWNDAVTCPNGIRNGLVQKEVGSIVPGMVAPATSGATAISGRLSVAFDGSAPVGIQGFADVWVNGAEAQLDFGVPAAVLKPQCAVYASVGDSPSGAVYPLVWNDQLCDNASCSVGHSGSSGTGCFAVTESGGDLVTTVEVGGCDVAAFPVLPPRAVVSLKQGLLDGLLARFETRGGAYSFHNDCGPSLILNGWAFSSWGEVLRPARRISVSSGSYLRLPAFIFNASGTAKDWGGTATLGVGGTATADGVAETFELRDYPGSSSTPPKGWGCAKHSGFSIPLTDSLPVYVWGGDKFRTFIGRAWVKLLNKDGQTADSHTGGAWSALVAFGSRDFTP